MNKGLLASFALLVGGAGLALGDGVVVTPGPAIRKVAAWLGSPTTSADKEAAPMPLEEKVADPKSTFASQPKMSSDSGKIDGPSIFTDEPCAEHADHCYRFWFEADYLLWWTKNSSQPAPLATTFPAGTVPVAGAPLPGSVGGPGTSTVLGGSSLDVGSQNGARFRLGGWLDHEHTMGLEAGYFSLANGSVSQAVGTTGLAGSPILAVPSVDVTGNPFLGGTPGVPHEARFPLGPFASPFAGDASGFGRGAVLEASTVLQGAEINGLLKLRECNGLRIDALAGFRWLNLKDDFSFATSTFGTTLAQGFFANTQDLFKSQNDFYGVQLGVRAEYSLSGLNERLRGAFVSGGFKLALGDTHERVDVNGNTANNFPFGGAPFFVPGGIFSQPSNIGKHTQDRFAVIPELELKIGYDVTSNVRLSLGYNFLCISNVARASDQIDRGINITRTGANQEFPLFGPPAGPQRPTLDFHTTSFWAQGLTLGVELRY
jgi:hypothetical protein